MHGSVSLRPATVQDLDAMYRWRNDPEIHRWFREQEGTLDWHDHVGWFQGRPEEREDLVIEYLGVGVGVVSIAADGDVGVYVGEKRLWGRGIASRALERAVEERSEPLRAQIHVENGASRRLFEGCGFEEVGREGDWLSYRRPGD